MNEIIIKQDGIEEGNLVKLSGKLVLLGVNDILYQEGIENVSNSVNPGFYIILLKNDVENDLFSFIEKNKLKSNDISEELMVVYLNEGVYSTGNGVCRMYSKADGNNLGDMIDISTENIAKIVGKNGELWQNRENL